MNSTWNGYGGWMKKCVVNDNMPHTRQKGDATLFSKKNSPLGPINNLHSLPSPRGARINDFVT